MNIDLQQLERNVNLHSLQPGFLNRELHYVIASDENNFRFAALEEQPGSNEQKFYCYLVDKPITIPAGNVILPKSYSLDSNPIYDVIERAEDFFFFIDCIGKNCPAKAIRGFDDGSIDNIYDILKHRYGNVEKHLVTSPEFQHLLFILPQVEISVSATMIYFKQRLPLTSEHYEHLKAEKA